MYFTLSQLQVFFKKLLEPAEDLVLFSFESFLCILPFVTLVPLYCIVSESFSILVFDWSISESLGGEFILADYQGRS